MLNTLLQFVVENDISLPVSLGGALVLLLAARALGRLTLTVPGDDWPPPSLRA